MWTFCLRSLVREYGWRFVRRIALPHPMRTLSAFRKAGELDMSGECVDVPWFATNAPDGGGDGVAAAPSIVAAGFCLKPLSPPCPSGRANHECVYLENLAGSVATDIPTPCRPCVVRKIGTRALRAGSAFYVMTSARDILDDVFVPAVARRTFTTGLFVLCRYSFQPFALGMLASGVSGRLFPLDAGDCRDYRTWLLADRGIKDEQTVVDDPRMIAIGRLLDAGAPPSRESRFERRGRVFHPAPAVPASPLSVELP